jgi:hypothetical protein
MRLLVGSTKAIALCASLWLACSAAGCAKPANDSAKDEKTTTSGAANTSEAQSDGPHLGTPGTEGQQTPSSPANPPASSDPAQEPEAGSDIPGGTETPALDEDAPEAGSDVGG